MDSTGAVIPDVAIVAHHQSLGLNYSTRSNEAGIFTLPEMREGEYTVSAAKAGFGDFKVDKVFLEPRNTRRVDIRLEVGAVTQTVEVSASAGLIQTENSTISAAKPEKALNSLPVTSQGFSYFFMTFPMVTARGSSPSIAGSRNDQFNIMIDGASASSGAGGMLSNLYGNAENFSEMRVEIANNSAEMATLGNVVLIGKSGENKLHGDFYDKYQTPVFRARDFFKASRDAGIIHSIGAGIGGPVVIPKLYNGKNRTFWYFLGDNYRLNSSLVALTPTVPLAAWRNGDFSALSTVIKDPFTGKPLAGNKIPVSQINPVSQKIQDRFYPLPNVGDTSVLTNRNYYQEFTGPPSSTVWHMQPRLDQRFTDKDYVYVSYNLHQIQVNSWEGNLPAFGPRLQKRQSKQLSMAYTHTFGASMINEFRFSHIFGNNPVEGPLNGPEVVNSLGLQGLAPNLPNISGVFQMGFTGLGLQGLSQVNYARPGFLNKVENAHDDFSWFHGKHAVKAGVQFSWTDNQAYGADANLFGNVTFSNKYTGQPYADFLYGVATTLRRSYPQPLTDRYRNNWDFYIQDDWRISPRLTLSAGMRYEYHAPWQEANGRFAAFDPGSGKIVVTDDGYANVSPFIPASYVGITTASDIGMPGNTIVKGDRNNFAPRLGLAWRPFGDTNTVVRSSYSIFYDQTPYQLGMTSPFILSEPAFTNTPVPSVVFPQVFPTTGIGKNTTLGLPAGVRSDLRIPQSQRWMFSIDRQQWNTGFSLAYIGTVTRQMWYTRNINQPMADSQLYINKVRPFMSYPSISYVDNGSSHSYNGLMFEVTRSLRSGLMINASYTWARDIGDDFSLENSFNRSRERGPDEMLPNQRFVANIMYQVPVGKGRKYFGSSNRMVDSVLGGWELGVISAQQTGQHLSPTISMQDPTGTAYTTSASRPTVTLRPDILGDPALSDPTAQGWYDKTAYSQPPVGRYGTSGRGTMLGPGLNVVHASLFKSFRFADSPRAPQFRVGMVATNVFNHTNLSNPNLSLSGGVATATITTTGGPNRSNPGDMAGGRAMWLHLRLEW